MREFNLIEIFYLNFVQLNFTIKNAIKNDFNIQNNKILFIYVYYYLYMYIIIYIYMYILFYFTKEESYKESL